MRCSPLMFAGLVVLAACGPGVDPDGSAVAAAALCQHFEASGLDCTATGARVETAGHTIEVAAYLDSFTRVPGASFASMRVSLAIDGTPMPTLDAIGVAQGSTQERAVEAGVANWSALYAQPLVGALRSSWSRPGTGAYAAIDMEGWKGHVGVPTERGDTDFDAVNSKTVLGTLASEVAQLDRSAAFHIVTLTIAVSDGKVSATSTCMLDNVARPSLCKAAAAYTWPGGSYTIQTGFVLVRAGE